MTDRWMTIDTLAEHIDTSRDTIERWRDDRALGFPEPARIGGKILYPWKDVSKWLDKRRRPEEASDLGNLARITDAARQATRR